jgi:hypothetical protein
MENQQRARFRKRFTVYGEEDRAITVVFDVVLDAYEPEGLLIATDELGEELARNRVPQSFRLTRQKAQQWVQTGLSERFLG